MRKHIYFTLVVKEPNEKWSPQFGDYDKEVVEQELEDTREDYPKGSRFKIIASLPEQKEIDRVIEAINNAGR